MLNLKEEVYSPLLWLASLLSITIIAGTLGWILAAFQSSLVVSAITFIFILHLSAVGESALILANLWLTSLISFAAFNKILPSTWNLYIPQLSADIWALNLIKIWIFSIISIFALAFLSQFYLKLKVDISRWTRILILGITILTALEIGSLAYEIKAIS